MSTTTHNPTTITVDPDLPKVVITRDFGATRDKVFRAHVDVDLVAQWMGPNGMTNRFDTWDARTGGSYRYVMARDGEEYGFYGAFHEVRPDERIVQTFTYDGEPDGVSLDMITFEELGGGRTRVTTVSVLDSLEGRDALIASGMETGVVEGYERLDDLLADDDA